MLLKVGAATSVGRVRPINEDAYLVHADRGLFVVCDGMGGAAAGEVASRLAVETIGAFVSNGALAATRPTAFSRVRRSRQGRGRGEPRHHRAAANETANAGMGTTVVGGVDRRWHRQHRARRRQPAYVSNAGGFEALTIDHSLVEAQVQAGLIDREQSLKSEHQNILLRALGRDPDTLVELGEVAIAAGDRLLLCTDGLTKTISDAASRPRSIASAAIRKAPAITSSRRRTTSGGPDNVTAVIVEIRDRCQWHAGCSLEQRACSDLLTTHRVLRPARALPRPMK